MYILIDTQCRNVRAKITHMSEPYTHMPMSGSPNRSRRKSS